MAVRNTIYPNWQSAQKLSSQIWFLHKLVGKSFSLKTCLEARIQDKGKMVWKTAHINIITHLEAYVHYDECHIVKGWGTILGEVGEHIHH